MNEQELREQIAQEIEAFRDAKILGSMEVIDKIENEMQRNFMAQASRMAGTAVTSAAAIARGNFHED